MPNKDQILGLIRHIITFAGGILVAKGKIDPTEVETITGIIVTISGVLFSFLAPEKAASGVKPT